MTNEDAQALAKTLNWEPPSHDGYPGSIPDNAWGAWRRFEAIAARAIEWRKVDAKAWREPREAEDAPDFEATSEGQHLLLVQHDWHGFPDPPEWALYIMEGESGEARCLGCFDIWPETWSALEMRLLDRFRQAMTDTSAPKAPEEIAVLLDACVRQVCASLKLAEAEIYCGGGLVTMFLTPKHAWEAVIVGADAYQLYPGFVREDGETIVWPNVWVADNYNLETFLGILEEGLAKAAEA